MRKLILLLLTLITLIGIAFYLIVWTADLKLSTKIAYSAICNLILGIPSGVLSLLYLNDILEINIIKILFKK